METMPRIPKLSKYSKYRTLISQGEGKILQGIMGLGYQNLAQQDSSPALDS